MASVRRWERREKLRRTRFGTTMAAAKPRATVLQRYDEQTRCLQPIEALPASGWVHLSQPTEAELVLLRRSLSLPDDVLRHALDVDELARTDHHDDGTDLIVLRVPWRMPEGGALPYRAASMSIVMHGSLFLTVATGPDEIVHDVVARGHVNPDDRGLLLVSLLLCAAERFLFHLRAIDETVSALEDSLRESQANREVMALLHYQKGLVHLATALSSNQIMLERLQKSERLRLPPKAHELLDDALIELRQAAEMTRVSSDILSQMMDAFASIISNNLNIVMKLLAVITTVLAVPTAIASFYGMNVVLPGQQHPYAFGIVVAISTVASGLFVWAILRKRLL